MQIVEERLIKHFKPKKAELERLKLNVDVAYSQSVKFRDISTGTLQELNIVEDFKALPKTFPTIKNERDIYPYSDVCQSLNTHFI